MSIDKVKQAIKVAEASGRSLSLQELIGLFPDMSAAILKSALGVKSMDTSEALDAGRVKAESGVVSDAEEKVEEVFAMEGTGKNTSVNRDINNNDKGIS